MRIIAGKYGGRQISSPKKHATHPMSEKIRGAMFNALGDIEGMSLFDAYSGSGAIAIESISRGANNVIACDIEKSAISTIKSNISELNINSAIKAVHANCVSYLQNEPRLFDIVVCDPPYDTVKISQLKSLAQYVKPRGLLILSLPPNIDDLEFEDFKLIKNKTYGDAQLLFYRLG